MSSIGAGLGLYCLWLAAATHLVFRTREEKVCSSPTPPFLNLPVRPIPESGRIQSSTEGISAPYPSQLQTIRVRYYSTDVRILLFVWLCVAHHLHPSVSAAVDRTCQSTYESHPRAGPWCSPMP